jgi:phosphoserine phosphatase RsbX
METVSGPAVWGVAAAALPGQAEIGDRHLVLEIGGGVLLAVIDGLGHGAEAAAAADAALRILELHAGEPLPRLVRRCHDGLAGTRGVALSIASYTTAERRLAWLGVGNVEGLLLRSDAGAGHADESLLLRPGVAGARLPDLQPSVVAILPDDTLIFATDGVRSDFARGLRRGDGPQRLADQILARHGKGTDDALVLVARFGGGGP